MKTITPAPPPCGIKSFQRGEIRVAIFQTGSQHLSFELSMSEEGQNLGETDVYPGLTDAEGAGAIAAYAVGRLRQWLARSLSRGQAPGYGS